MVGKGLRCQAWLSLAIGGTKGSHKVSTTFSHSPSVICNTASMGTVQMLGSFTLVPSFHNAMMHVLWNELTNVCYIVPHAIRNGFYCYCLTCEYLLELRSIPSKRPRISYFIVSLYGLPI